MKEDWKKVEDSLNEKEVEQRSGISSSQVVDLPPELQAYITETITNDVELSDEENALMDLRIDNVRKSARSFHSYDKKLTELREARRKFEERFPITSIQNRPQQIIDAMKKINSDIADAEASIEQLMQSSPEAYIVRNALKLREYRKQLKYEGFVLTPYAEKKLDELQDNYYAIDKIPFLNGETGSGKSSLAKYFVEKVLSTEPERIAGAKGIDETKIFGKIDLTSDERGPQAVFVKGPLYIAMEKGCPLVIEEVNAIPPEILKSLNDVIINAKKGEEVPVIGDPKGSKIRAKAGFGVVMTGNLNRNPKAIDRYKGLFELSADFVNRIRPIDYDYLPQSTEGSYVEGAGKDNELYTLMIAMVMNDKGDVNAPEEAFDDLWRLAKFTRKVQEVYSGQRDGKIFSGQGGLGVPLTATSSVISMRDIKQVIESWKRDNFEKEFDYYIYRELIAPLTNVMDVKFFVQQLQAEGFFADSSWKDVIARAGTFDSAVHSPENKGREMVFTTVREVVENVYGDSPERTEFPYDVEALKKNESKVNDLERRTETLRKYISDESPDSLKEQLGAILQSSLQFLSDIKELSSSLKNALKSRDTKRINDVISSTEKSFDEFSKKDTSKLLDFFASLSPNDMLVNIMRQVEYAMENESSLAKKLSDTYTDKFQVDADFVAYHAKYLQELRDQFPVTTIDDLKKAQKRKKELQIRKLLGEDISVEQMTSSTVDSFNSIANLNKAGQPFRAKIDEENYPNLANDPNINFGAKNYPRFNPDLPSSKDMFNALHLSKVKLNYSPEVEEIFANAEDLFKDKERTGFNKFYHRGWTDDKELQRFSVSIDSLKRSLSGFIYSEPWMVKSFILGEEEWRENEYVKDSFSKMYVDSEAIFCIKKKDGTDVMVKVKRTADFNWEISKVITSQTSTRLFIAPQIVVGF